MGSLDRSLSDGNDVENSSGMAINISGEVMIAAVVFVFLLFILVLFLYLYSKYYLDGSSSLRRRAQLISAAGHATNPSRGVEASTVRSIPITIYQQSEFKDWLECSVCLCDLTDGEETRLLPKCNHGFHLECIDTWFQSHSTCPLCRCPVGPDTAIAVGEDAPVVSVSGDRQAFESLALPTNVLFWGNQEGVNIGVSFPLEMNSSSSTSAHFRRTLVISVPGGNRTIVGLPSPTSTLPSSTLPAENLKSQVEEARPSGTSKFISLRRILSRGKKTGGSSSTTPMEEDVELGFVEGGEGSPSVLKTPTSS